METIFNAQAFPLFAVAWAALSVAGAAFFLLNRDAALKRKMMLPFMLVAVALFLGFAVYVGAPNEFLLLAVPLSVLIIALNLRTIRFCDACGRTVSGQNPFAPAKFCSKCGASLEGKR